ncbi:RING finger and CHY zinc finger domain-containing protein 1, partial [Galemys pyrenaicus]
PRPEIRLPLITCSTAILAPVVASVGRRVLGRRCCSGRGFHLRKRRWREVEEMATSAQEDGARGPERGRRGCEHYDRGCLLKAPCCDKLYTCRLCHDNQEDHQLDRFKVKEVQCINCEKIQHAQQTCEECSTLFGEYYCNICHLFDKDKKQYHCENCGICRIGPKEDFFHCLKCNLCLAMNLQGKHKCIENVSRQNCPICLEDIHTSRVVAHVLPCGHLLHRTCYEEMLKEGYRCPLCMHSALDMTRYWRQLDDEVAHTPMPSEYQNMTVDKLLLQASPSPEHQPHLNSASPSGSFLLGSQSAASEQHPDPHSRMKAAGRLHRGLALTLAFGFRLPQHPLSGLHVSTSSCSELGPGLCLEA